MKNKPLIIAVAVLLLIGFLLSWHFVNKANQKADIATAIIRHDRETYEANIEQLQLEKNGHKAVSDSLKSRVTELKVELRQSKYKEAQTALKLKKDIAKNKLLTNDSSVMLFYANAGYGNLPVIKRDTAYQVPIQPIRYYNDLQTEHDALADDNSTLKKREVVYQKIINTQDADLQEKDKQLVLCDSISATQSIITEGLKQEVKNEHKKFIDQKVKTYLVGAIGVLGITLGIIF